MVETLDAKYNLDTPLYVATPTVQRELSFYLVYEVFEGAPSHYWLDYYHLTRLRIVVDPINRVEEGVLREGWEMGGGG